MFKWKIEPRRKSYDRKQTTKDRIRRIDFHINNARRVQRTILVESHITEDPEDKRVLFDTIAILGKKIDRLEQEKSELQQ